MIGSPTSSVRAGCDPTGANRPIVLRAVLIAVAVALLAGCGGDDDGADTAAAPPATPAPESGPPSSPEKADTAVPVPTETAPTESNEATPTTVEPLAESEPVEIEVDALGVKQEIIPLGLTDEGVMEVPQGPDPVGWYDRSPTPGEMGPSVLAGHVTWDGTDGVFRHLEDLADGDVVTVTRNDGSAARFEITRVEQYPKDTFPTAQVYGNTPGPELRLITCAGDYDPESGDYSDNVVAYAELMQ